MLSNWSNIKNIGFLALICLVLLSGADIDQYLLNSPQNIETTEEVREKLEEVTLATKRNLIPRKYTSFIRIIHSQPRPTLAKANYLVPFPGRHTSIPILYRALLI
jgi:hypothetical protein